MNRRQPFRIVSTASAAVVKIGWGVRYGEVQPLLAVREPPRKSRSARRPGWDPMCQNSQPIVVRGSMVVRQSAADARAPS